MKDSEALEADEASEDSEALEADEASEASDAHKDGLFVSRNLRSHNETQ